MTQKKHRAPPPWGDIEDAPKDATVVDLWIPGDDSPGYRRVDLHWGMPVDSSRDEEAGWLNDMEQLALEEGEYPSMWVHAPPDPEAGVPAMNRSTGSEGVGGRHKADSLAAALPREMTRVRGLIPLFDAIPTGFFAAGMMRQSLGAAQHALAEGNVIAMLRSYEDLKGYSA